MFVFNRHIFNKVRVSNRNKPKLKYLDENIGIPPKRIVPCLCAKKIESYKY